MKHKNLVIIILVCIFLTFIPIIYYVCTYQDIPDIKRKIDFTAVYDKESNNINAVITNNTGDMAVTYIENYKVHKKENSVWYQIIEDKGLSLWPAERWVMPYSGDNKSEIAFPAYNKDDNSDTVLESGLYKLEMRVSVYDSSQFEPIRGGFTVKASPQSKFVTIETEFAVE